eukprot:CAMPEP_0197534194 /NCGR_PEP_ID=MMETSP1318-20131121/46260_1 /TAXON_ID=552666 /ORGANISM="Partenskyella glossopodia, Strain RCC365" /LENGTH=144 /DNA_ID=CAMNT_0043091367 /DNA_START=179 /DNA_END=613 /DNA_ORIENTATION=+
MTKALEINYRLTEALSKKHAYNPPMRLRKPEVFRNVIRHIPKRTKLGLLSSPFVHKKSGENWVYEHYQADICVHVEAKDDTPIEREPRGVLRFLLRNYPVPFAYKNVELRLTSIEPNATAGNLDKLKPLPGIFKSNQRRRPFKK